CSYERFLSGYRVIAGVTGTARGARHELAEVHGLVVYRLDPHTPCQRVDAPDHVAPSERAKLEALVEEVARCHALGQPVLVGVSSELKASLVSRHLAARGLPHQRLTAKDDAREAA